MDRTVADPMIGRVLDGRYLVGPRIARGGMATVYEATDRRLDRVCALKIMHSGLGDDAEFAARFVREARSAARLSHPHVVGVFDQGDDDGTVFLAMEYIPGHTLRDVIRKEAPLTPTKALALMDPVLSALATAHQAGLIHRDVKPENVLIADDGRIKVADFGLARAVTADTQHTATGGVLIGTVSYLAPELVVEGRADARCDVYAAGVVIYEMLTGHKPHEGESPIQIAYAHVHEDIPPPSRMVPGIPPYVDALVARATARDRDLRAPDARVLLHQVRRVRAALDQGVPDDPDLTGDLSPTVPVQTRGRDSDRDAPAEPDDFIDYVRDEVPTILTAEQVAVGGRTDQTSVLSGPPRQPPPQRRQPAGKRPPAGQSRQRTRRSRRGPILLAVVLLAAVLAGAAGWWFGAGRYQRTPGVIDLTAAQARAKVQHAGLHFAIAGRAFSETVPAGSVVHTDPNGGERILHDGTVRATISRGPERSEVPTMRGMSLADAKTALAKVHLDLGEVTRKYDARVAKGVVISSDPPPLTERKRGAPVDLVVSKGARPIKVPDFTGKDATEAQKKLGGLGFDVRVSRKHDDTAPAGTVISQDPHGGTAFRGDTITLLVSKGPVMVEVPKVVGMGTEDAKTALEAAGFEVATEHSTLYVGLEYVVGQDPSPGSKAPKGSTVTLSLV
ncbi:MAG TPA: Stk1 family PASTA domain-containing Ser/Thr kinase [Nocardioidaceae bacterium]|nr:Stk1 family PASTA domain-containing Ser/Thr kinase [Nocardioidaceae bacterium]